MKVTRWVHKGNWDLQQKTIVIWEAVCWRCGAIADNHGYDEQEAIAVAQEEGWMEGLCFECWVREQERRAEVARTW